MSLAWPLRGHDEVMPLDLHVISPIVEPDGANERAGLHLFEETEMLPHPERNERNGSSTLRGLALQMLTAIPDQLEFREVAVSYDEAGLGIPWPIRAEGGQIGQKPHVDVSEIEFNIGEVDPFGADVGTACVGIRKKPLLERGKHFVRDRESRGTLVPAVLK